MRSHALPALACLSLLAPGCSSPAKTSINEPRVDLHLDAEEAELALDLAERAARSEPIVDADWEKLEATQGYRRLVLREKSIGREFRQENFRAFVLSEELAAELPALRETLDAWKKADLRHAADRALAYLPRQATIRATVLPVVKPHRNSFVFEPATDPAIFLAVDPALSREQFEDVVAHELHHIGFASLPRPASARPPEVERVLPWIGAFGEGFAVLAAAGGPEVHPHEHGSPEDRERWDRDVARFDEDLARIQGFLLDVLDDPDATDEEIRGAGMAFFGEQGPWYTVGWKMSVTVEQRYGRAVLIECMLEPDRLLATYNVAATSGARWSDELIARLGAQPIVPQ